MARDLDGSVVYIKFAHSRNIQQFFAMQAGCLVPRTDRTKLMKDLNELVTRGFDEVFTSETIVECPFRNFY